MLADISDGNHSKVYVTIKLPICIKLPIYTLKGLYIFKYALRVLQHYNGEWSSLSLQAIQWNITKCSWLWKNAMVPIFLMKVLITICTGLFLFIMFCLELHPFCSAYDFFFFFFFAIILSVRLGVPCWFSKATYWYVSVIFLMSWQDLVYSNSQSPHSKGMLTMRYLLHTASMGIHEAMFVVDSTHSSFFSSLLTGWPLYLHWCKADLLL